MCAQLAQELKRKRVQLLRPVECKLKDPRLRLIGKNQCILCGQTMLGSLHLPSSLICTAEKGLAASLRKSGSACAGKTVLDMRSDDRSRSDKVPDLILRIAKLSHDLVGMFADIQSENA